MKTIKIIDLLIKIANGEELPNKIKYYGYVFEYDTNHLRYETYFDEQIWTLQDFANINDSLNDEVEIIEDTPKHFGREENQAVKNIIKKNSVPVKENYNDYYEDTPKEDKKIEKLDYCEENTFMKQKETTYLSQKERLLLDSNFKELGKKINEIIDKINVEK